MCPPFALIMQAWQRRRIDLISVLKNSCGILFQIRINAGPISDNVNGWFCRWRNCRSISSQMLHVEYPTGTKNRHFVEDHPRNIPAKFGSNWPSGFGDEAWNVKSLQTTDNRRRTPIVHLWSRWTKKPIRLACNSSSYGRCNFTCNGRW